MFLSALLSSTCALLSGVIDPDYFKHYLSLTLQLEVSSGSEFCRLTSDICDSMVKVLCTCSKCRQSPSSQLSGRMISSQSRWRHELRDKGFVNSYQRPIDESSIHARQAQATPSRYLDLSEGLSTLIYSPSHHDITPSCYSPLWPLLPGPCMAFALCRGQQRCWDGLPLSGFKTDQISAAATFVNQPCTKGSSISAAIWDLCRENRQSVLFSAHLRAVRPVGENLFMFNFDKDSTVKWKLTVTTPAHALLLCCLDPQLDEIGLAHYLLENGIPFHTLQASTTLSRSPLSNHPPLVIPTRNANYEFSWRDYEAFQQQCHIIFKQVRGRAALLKGYYPWHLAINNIGFSSALSGPSGLSTKSEEMLVVRIT